MPTIDKFYQGKIKYFINTHEQNSGHSATGYAKMSNRTGVVISTSGPGATNLVTPLLDAQNDSVPLVPITGQVNLKNLGTDAFQEAPSTQITKSFTKDSFMVRDTGELEDAIDYAFKLANDGKKGAVHIDVPKCISTNIFEKRKIIFFNKKLKI